MAQAYEAEQAAAAAAPAPPAAPAAPAAGGISDDVVAQLQEARRAADFRHPHRGGVLAKKASCSACSGRCPQPPAGPSSEVKTFSPRRSDRYLDQELPAPLLPASWGGSEASRAHPCPARR